MPFTEWPYGGATAPGVTRPRPIDSLLIVALPATSFGQFLSDKHFQIYGRVDPRAGVTAPA